MTTSLREDSHAYTRSDVPWTISVRDTDYGRLINYISGGGMQTFGRTVRQEETSRRQRTFVLVSAVMAFLWLLFLVF